MRLIDADALIESIVEEAQDLRTLSTKTVGQAISKTPTVDAVPVIRCKDCKHWQYESCFVESEEGDAESIILDRFAFDFCSRAERRTDETD